jgi:hypothetical protein
MRHCHATFFRRVLELFVAASLIYFEPAIPFEFPDNIPAIHSTFPPKITIHTAYTLIHFKRMLIEFWDVRRFEA